MSESPAIFNLLPILPFLPLAAFVVIVLWAQPQQEAQRGDGNRRHWAVMDHRLGDCFHYVPHRRLRRASVPGVPGLAAHRARVAGVRLCAGSAVRRDALHGAVRLPADLRLRGGLHGGGQALGTARRAGQAGRTGERGPTGQPLLRLHRPLCRRDDRPDPGRQPDPVPDLLGADGLVLLPPDRLLVCRASTTIRRRSPRRKPG